MLRSGCEGVGVRGYALAMENRGLGRGLGSILKSTEDTVFPLDASPQAVAGTETMRPATAPAAETTVGEELSDAVLHAMGAALPIDFGLHLLVGDDNNVQVRFWRPGQSPLGHAELFEVFSAADRVLRHGGIQAFRAIDRDMAAVCTSGATSRGVWVVGRSRKSLKPRHRRLFIQLARTVGDVTHQLHADETVGPFGAGATSITMEMADAGVVASVGFPSNSGELTGVSSHSSALRAVAAASVEALGEHLHLDHLSEVDTPNAKAVLVILDGPDGSLGAGVALSTDETLGAAATAVKRAAQVLTPDLAVQSA